MTRAVLYPYATHQLLTPEATKPVTQGGEPNITPVLYVDHRHGFDASSQAVGRYFNQQAVKVESHVSFPKVGGVVQFQRFDRQADAQGKANGFRRPGNTKTLFGAISGETEDDGDADGLLTQEQITAKALFLAWLHIEWEIPLFKATSDIGSGIGYHRQYTSWNPNGHACPNPKRVKQLYEKVLPGALWLVAMSQRQPQATDIVDELTVGGSTWQLQRDGGVLTVKGNRFFGSYPGLPAAARQGQREFGSIEAHDGGYKLVATSDETYHFPAPKAA